MNDHKELEDQKQRLMKCIQAAGPHVDLGPPINNNKGCPVAKQNAVLNAQLEQAKAFEFVEVTQCRRDKMEACYSRWVTNWKGNAAQLERANEKLAAENKHLRSSLRLLKYGYFSLALAFVLGYVLGKTL